MSTRPPRARRSDEWISQANLRGDASGPTKQIVEEAEKEGRIQLTSHFKKQAVLGGLELTGRESKLKRRPDKFDRPQNTAWGGQRTAADGYRIHTTINPVDPKFLTGINQPPAKGNAAGKQHIAHRVVLPYDIDAIRPKGEAATEQEREAAREIASRVAAWWSERGVVAEIVDSGNGFQVEVPIDLPNDAEAEQLVKAVLETHKAKFDAAGAKIDVLYDANRIMRLPGYLNLKGNDSPERPRREVQLIQTASGCATREMFVEIAAVRAPTRKGGIIGSSGLGPDQQKIQRQQRLVESLLETAGYLVAGSPQVIRTCGR